MMTRMSDFNRHDDTSFIGEADFGSIVGCMVFDNDIYDGDGECIIDDHDNGEFDINDDFCNHQSLLLIV